jgi:hypothetical protein
MRDQRMEHDQVAPFYVRMGRVRAERGAADLPALDRRNVPVKLKSDLATVWI